MNDLQQPPHLKLANCRACGVPGVIAPGMRTGTFIAECSNRIDCHQWPATTSKPTPEAAAEAWNKGEVTNAFPDDHA